MSPHLCRFHRSTQPLPDTSYLKKTFHLSFLMSALSPLFSRLLPSIPKPSPVSLSSLTSPRSLSSLPTSTSVFSCCCLISLQACELHVAGYRFSVLSTAFVVHRGFKIQGEFHARKDEENKRNRVLFRNFKEGLKTKYPSSARRC